MDTFTVFVSHTSSLDAFGAVPAVTVVEVLASGTNDATLTAMQMVACVGGRCPVGAEVDWDAF